MLDVYAIYEVIKITYLFILLSLTRNKYHPPPLPQNKKIIIYKIKKENERERIEVCMFKERDKPALLGEFDGP